MTSGVVLRLDGSTASAIPNLELVADSNFEHVPSGDLHLSATAPDAVDEADPAYLKQVPEDIDGQLRDLEPDYGADERL